MFLQYMHINILIRMYFLRIFYWIVIDYQNSLAYNLDLIYNMLLLEIEYKMDQQILLLALLY